jgi:hypothetical protein
MTIAMVLFCGALWSGICFAQTANPTVEYRKQMIEKMKARHKLHKSRPEVKKISGTVDKSLKPRATVVIPKK